MSLFACNYFVDEDQARTRIVELEAVNSHLSLEVASRRNNELVQQEMLKELASRNATLEHFRSGELFFDRYGHWQRAWCLAWIA